jgi:hypothetical protein
MPDPVSGSYYWCLVHEQAEPEDGCANSQRLGPYASLQEAERALEKVQERNRRWDNDPNWNDDVEDLED